MKRCIELALQGELFVAPNPMVGCVIVHNGTIVAEAYHARYGEAHAEVNAFNKLKDSIDSNECEVYVNLEPCSHYGKTPPCADLLAYKQPKRVIIGMLDPHSKVSGSGIKKLMEAGIDVKVGVLEEDCRQLNRKFIKAHTTPLPYVTLKWAETADGYMASAKGQIKISDPLNDKLVHSLRAAHQAILVGAGTVNTDTPLLDVRLCDGRNPTKIILSENLTVDTSLKTIENGSKSIIYNNFTDETRENYTLVKLDSMSIETILKNLHQRGIHSILVEGGPTVLRAFLDEKMWDIAIVLKSDKQWKQGIKSPWVGIPSVREMKSGNDTIKYFTPK